MKGCILLRMVRTELIKVIICCLTDVSSPNTSVSTRFPACVGVVSHVPRMHEYCVDFEV